MCVCLCATACFCVCVKCSWRWTTLSLVGNLVPRKGCCFTPSMPTTCRHIVRLSSVSPHCSQGCVSYVALVAVSVVCRESVCLHERPGWGGRGVGVTWEEGGYLPQSFNSGMQHVSVYLLAVTLHACIVCEEKYTIGPKRLFQLLHWTGHTFRSFLNTLLCSRYQIEIPSE